MFFIQIALAQKPFDQARSFLDKADYTSCTRILDSCHAAKYHSDSVLFYLGLVKFKTDNIEAGQRYIALLNKEYPDFYEVHYLKGLLYFSKKNYAKSADEFTRVIEKDPRNVKAYFNRSVALGQLEEFLDAISDLGECIKLEPSNPQNYYSRAYWYEYTGNYPEAAKDYQFAIGLDPRNYDAYMGLAYVYKNLKDDSKACEVINKAISAGSQIADEVKINFCR